MTKTYYWRSTFLVLQDHLTAGIGAPPPDNQQDWILTHSSENNGVTKLMFYRKLNTTDAEDIAIEVNQKLNRHAIGIYISVVSAPIFMFLHGFWIYKSPFSVGSPLTRCFLGFHFGPLASLRRTWRGMIQGISETKSSDKVSFKTEKRIHQGNISIWYHPASEVIQVLHFDWLP